MKTKLITNLNSRVLLVDGIESEAKHIRLIKFNEHFQINYDLPKQDNYNVGGGFRLNFDDFGGRKHYPANLTYLGKLIDLTDSDCEGLIYSYSFGSAKSFNNYKYKGGNDYRDIFENGFETAKESLLSALESEGVLFENPHGAQPRYFYDKNVNPSDILAKAYSKQWKEAEKNVFSPETLIFVEL